MQCREDRRRPIFPSRHLGGGQMWAKVNSRIPECISSHTKFRIIPKYTILLHNTVYSHTPKQHNSQYFCTILQNSAYLYAPKSAPESKTPQIVENLTPNKANLTQLACKWLENAPLNLFFLRQVPRALHT